MKCMLRYILMASFFIINQGLHAETVQTDAVIEHQSFTDKVNNLKQEVIELNRDLLILEQELLYPVDTQINVFVSIDTGVPFELDSVQLKIDDKVVSNYLYTERELQSLHRGGVQRLYVGNMTTGKHKLTTVFIGKEPSDRHYKRTSTFTINKKDKTKFVELKIKANASTEQQGISVKVWE